MNPHDIKNPMERVNVELGAQALYYQSRKKSARPAPWHVLRPSQRDRWRAKFIKAQSK